MAAIAVSVARALSAAVLCCAATITPVAHADDDKDIVFIAVLDTFDVPYESKTEAITMAKALCLWYAVNESFFEMGAIEVLKENPGWTADDAGHFAGAATSAYCPKYSPPQR